MENVQKRQNSSINFLRFLFTAGICFMHLVCQVITPYISSPFSYNNFGAISFCVEMFFIMAGYFLFFSHEPLVNYIKKRIIRLWPLLAFSTAVAGILRTFYISLISLSIDDIWNLLFLQGTGLFQGGATNGPAWFVGVLFWTSLIYFMLKTLMNNKYFIIFTILLIITGLCLLWLPPGDIIFTKIREFTPIGGGWISIMLLRGIIAVGIGCLLGKLQEYFLQHNNIKEFLSSHKFKSFMSFLEIILFISLCFTLVFGSLIKLIETYFISIFLFISIFFMFINNLGFFSSLVLNKKIFNTLGKYSYSIYIMQNVVFYIIDYCLRTYSILTFHPYFVIIISMVLFLCVGISSYYIVNLILNFLSYLINKTFKIKEIFS